MILQMMPEVVSRQWDALSKHIAKSLPERERSHETMNNILEGILRNQLSCWISYDAKNNNDINFVFILAPLEDPYKGERNLLVYTITRLKQLDQETTVRMYKEGYVALGKYMKSRGFNQLVGYIDEHNTKLADRAKQFGAVLRFHWTLPMGGE